MAFYLDKILAIPVWDPNWQCWCSPLVIINRKVRTQFYCLNCYNKLKIKKVDDIIRWRKCPTCGFVFIDKQYFTVDELLNDLTKPRITGG